MISALDLYRTANVLVQQYGPEEALLMAAKRCDALLESGDVYGQRAWKGVPKSIEGLRRSERKIGERVN
jgi:hypothetical protein